MNDHDYEYRGLIASSWDLLRGDTSDWPDRPFYRKIIANDGQPALDVGCGTGRLLLGYLSEGLDVDGLDVSPEMLQICLEKAQDLDLNPTIYQQAIESLNVPRKYRTIFIPSGSFQLLTDLSSAEAALERCYRHLRRGGKLVMSIMDVSQGSTEDWQLLAEQQRPRDGLVVRRWWKATYDPESQLQDTEDRFELLKDGEVIATELHTRSPATRVYALDQISEMLETAGFRAIQTVTGFTEEPASPEDSVFCVIGSRI